MKTESELRRVQIVKGAKVRDNGQIRNSFFKLGNETFGLQYDDWYENGYWDETYIPYCAVEEGRVVANCAVSVSTLVIDGNPYKAGQIGGVMTAPEYRGQGLSRKLMEAVLEDFRCYDFLYLFANESVLDFYPKFGFKKVAQQMYSMNTSELPFNPTNVKKMDISNKAERKFVHEMAKHRLPVSNTVGVLGNESIVMFHALLAYPHCIYYLPTLDAVIIGEIDGETFRLYDVIIKKYTPLEKIITALPIEQCTTIQFYFTPHEMKNVITEEEESHLFVREQGETPYPINQQIPATSIT